MPVAILASLEDHRAALLLASLTSFVLDYAARLKMGRVHVNFFILKQLPVLPPNLLRSHVSFIRSRVLELTYTSHDMTSFAQILATPAPPSDGIEERRPTIRAELNALFFHLYGIFRDDAAYILDTFPIVKRKDEAKYGTYRTKDFILAEYDRMAAAGVGPDTRSLTVRTTPPPSPRPRATAPAMP